MLEKKCTFAQKFKRIVTLLKNIYEKVCILFVHF